MTNTSDQEGPWGLPLHVQGPGTVKTTRSKEPCDNSDGCWVAKTKTLLHNFEVVIQNLAG